MASSQLNTRQSSKQSIHVVSNVERSAEWSAVAGLSEQRLRVPYYCEENVWRLAYRRSLSSKHNKHPDSMDYVVFISNPIKQTPFYHQKAAMEHESDRDKVVVWDYHVILVHVHHKHAVRQPQSSTNLYATDIVNNNEIDKNNNNDNDSNEPSSPRLVCQVFDMDSTLPYPCSLAMYLAATFRTHSIDYTNDIVCQRYKPWFRVVPALDFLRNFYSDRSHMYDFSRQCWSAPPPPYLCIMNGYQNLDFAKARTTFSFDGKDNTKRSNLNRYTDMTTPANSSTRRNSCDEANQTKKMDNQESYGYCADMDDTFEIDNTHPSTNDTDIENYQDQSNESLIFNYPKQDSFNTSSDAHASKTNSDHMTRDADAHPVRLSTADTLMSVQISAQEESLHQSPGQESSLHPSLQPYQPKPAANDNYYVSSTIQSYDCQSNDSTIKFDNSKDEDDEKATSPADQGNGYFGQVVSLEQLESYFSSM